MNKFGYSNPLQNSHDILIIIEYVPHIVAVSGSMCVDILTPNLLLLLPPCKALF